MRAPAAFLFLLALAGSGCSAVQASVYRTGPTLSASTAPVVVSATQDPAHGQELGIVEVSGGVGPTALDALVTEFRARVASLGGDYGRIDRYAVKHEWVTETRSYECGSMETEWETQTITHLEADGTTSTSTETVPQTHYVSKTCTEDVDVEEAVRTITGRAFLTSPDAPKE